MEGNTTAAASGLESTVTTEIPELEFNATTEFVEWPSTRRHLPDSAHTFSITPTSTTTSATSTTSESTTGISTILTTELSTTSTTPSTTNWHAKIPPRRSSTAPDAGMVVLVTVLAASLGIAVLQLVLLRRKQAKAQQKDRLIQLRWSQYRQIRRQSRPVTASVVLKDYAIKVQGAPEEVDSDSFHSISTGGGSQEVLYSEEEM